MEHRVTLEWHLIFSKACFCLELGLTILQLWLGEGGDVCVCVWGGGGGGRVTSYIWHSTDVCTE